MIQPNELRVGNTVAFKDEISSIVKIDSFWLMDGQWFVEWTKIVGCENTQEGCDLLDEFEPIPLSPELLEACGFANGGIHDGGKSSWRRKEFPFGIDLPSVYYYDDGHCIECTYIEYLHQLQNLYFALTGTELSINLEKVKV